MTVRRLPRLVMPLRERRNPARAVLPWPERLLHELGAHSSFSDALLGDLAEEREKRAEQEGPLAARWWYARESLRSVPHLLLNAARHGGPRGRARAASVLLALALVPTAAVIAVLLRNGPPAHLFIEGQRGADVSDGIVLNTRRPVQLAVRVLDAKGHALPSTDVRYRWAAGMPLKVTPSGVVTCRRRGDATVRASIGALETSVLLYCRPVKDIRTQMGINFIAGDSGRDLSFYALGLDGSPVDRLAGELRVTDSTVATLAGTRIRPVAPGHATVILRAGDTESWTRISVYEPVRSLEGLRPDQRLVVVPVRLRRAETIRWPLPMGLFRLQYGRTSGAQAIPDFAVEGLVMCMPDFTPTIVDVSCLVRAPGATLRMTHPVIPSEEIAGSLALERYGDRPRSPADP